MNCFNHNDTAAIGLCKHCSKALCSQCVTDTGVGLACTASCVDEVKSIHSLIARNKRTMTSQTRNAYLSPVFFVGMGLLFLGHGLWRDGIFSFGVAMGLGFAVFGIVLFLRVRRWKASLSDA